MKIVINTCYGGFTLSKEAYDFLGLDYDDREYDYEDDFNRDDPRLIECVELLGGAAAGNFAKLKIVEIPDDVKWRIEEYDGKEKVVEIHRVWE